MKNLFFTSFALLFLAINASSQVRPEKKEATQKETKTIESKEEYYLKMGRVYYNSNNKEVMLEKEVKFKNGTTLNTDGTLILKDGKKVKLKGNEYIDSKGVIHARKKK